MTKTQTHRQTKRGGTENGEHSRELELREKGKEEQRGILCMD